MFLNEKQLQTLIMQELDYLGKLTDKFFAYHTANEGKRTISYGRSLKRQGMKAGVADITLMINGGITIYLEIKTEKGKQSKSQKEFEEICKKRGFPYYVVRSIEDVKLILKKYNCLKKN